ncbi:hypothetical protein EDB87DRAFT_222930 [Lactarius vividus]|nr:hypothetical protein EDB87DRAFT_222930 [Lactarius vividus]
MLSHACLLIPPRPLPCIAAGSGPSRYPCPIQGSCSLLIARYRLREAANRTVPFCLFPTAQNFGTSGTIVFGQDSFTIRVTASMTSVVKFHPSLAAGGFHVFVTNSQRKAETLRMQKLKDVPSDVIVCSVVFDVDRLGSIHDRLAEMRKNEECDTTDKIIHGSDDDESDTA